MRQCQISSPRELYKKTQEFTYIIFAWFLGLRRLDSVRNKAQYRTDPEQCREATKQIPAKLHPLGRRLRRGERIGAVALENLSGLLLRKTLDRVRFESADEFLHGDFVLLLYAADTHKLLGLSGFENAFYLPYPTPSLNRPCYSFWPSCPSPFSFSCSAWF